MTSQQETNSRLSQARTNAVRLDVEIQKLHNGHWDRGRRDFKEFWLHVKHISELFKTLKPLTSEDRSRLWKEFGAICEQAKAEHSESKRLWEARVNDSKQKRALVESKISEALFHACGADSHEDLKHARTLVQEAREWMKDGWGGFNAATQLTNVSEGRLLREDRDACWEKLRETEDAIANNREKLWDRDYTILHSTVTDIYNEAHIGNPKEAKNRVISTRTELKNTFLKRAHADELHELLNDAWNRAKQRLEEKHEAWLDKMREHIDRWSEIIERKEQQKRNLEEQIERCEEMESNAVTGEFVSEVRGWIDEKLSRINELDSHINELQGKIASVESRINS